MKRYVVGSLVAVILTAVVASTAMAYSKISTGWQRQQPITVYLGVTPPQSILDNPRPWSCRSQLPGDKNCYGAEGSILQVGDAAVHMINGQWNNPVATFGSMVTVPKTISLRRPDGTWRTSNIFCVEDTGDGSEYSSYNAWLDIYAGDEWTASPTRNPYTWDNVNTVKQAFQNPASSRWDLYYDVL